MTLTDDLFDAVSTHGQRVALDAWDAKLDYAALGKEVRRVAGALAEITAPGDRVAVLAARSAAATVAFHGVLGAGAVCVPVHAGSPPARVAKILELTGAELLLHDGSHARTAAKLPQVTKRLLDDLKGDALRAPTSAQLAYVLTTSGSTGAPKGVAYDHAAATVFPRWAREELALAPGDRVAALAPLAFDLATFDLFAVLSAGATVCVPPHEALLFPAALAEWFACERIDVAYAVPSLWTRLTAAGADLTSLRAAIFAGEVYPIPELRALARAAPEARLLNFYGPTETNVCTAHEVHRPIPDEPLPIGRLLPGFEARLEHEVEGVGELVVSGPGVMAGYWPPQGRARTHATGDYVSLGPEGFRFHGRRDRMVKLRGHRVELGEVEHALAPHVSEVAVIVDGEVLRAYYVGDARPARLKATLSRALPAYMLPELERRDALPRTPNGKVDLRALARR